MLDHSSSLASTRGGVIIEETLHYVRSTLDAPAVSLAWLDDGGEYRDAGDIGMPASIEKDYFAAGVHHLDPLFPKKLVSRSEQIHCLSTITRAEPAQAKANGYATFLARYGYEDEVDLVFSDGGTPFANLIIFSTHNFSGRLQALQHLHRFLQHTISCHPHVREQARLALLRNRFGLTRREVEVVDLICSGASNAEIASDRGIGMATVKTHVVRVLDKLGVNSRCALVAFIKNL